MLYDSEEEEEDEEETERNDGAALGCADHLLEGERPVHQVEVQVVQLRGPARSARRGGATQRTEIEAGLQPSPLDAVPASTKS